MTFKIAWEKTDLTYDVTMSLVQDRIRQWQPDKKVAQFEVISGGCANINIKVFLEDDPQPHLLRLYLRDKEAVFREQKLGVLLGNILPVPQIEFLAEREGFFFGVTSFLEGISLRTLLLSRDSYDLGEIMFQVGQSLSTIGQCQFEESGFFDKNLSIVSSPSPVDLVQTGLTYLKGGSVSTYLGPELARKCKLVLEKGQDWLPSRDEKNLVHGDFGPENILVVKQEKRWVISGILDWEFAFSGSTLWDVANMMRYARSMPVIFEESFWEGMGEMTKKFPTHWRSTIQLLTLLSLLDILHRTSPLTHPETWVDCKNLIDQGIRFFKQSGSLL